MWFISAISFLIISFIAFIVLFINSTQSDKTIQVKWLLLAMLNMFLIAGVLCVDTYARLPTKEQQMTVQRQYNKTLESLIGKKIKTIDSSGYKLEIVTEGDGRIEVTGYKGITPRFQEAR